MASYCKKCSLEHFDKDYGDLADLGRGNKLTPEEIAKGIGWQALCEGCGPICVDDFGEKIETPQPVPK